MRKRTMDRVRGFSILCAVCGLLGTPQSLPAQDDEIARLTTAVAEGPSWYLTPEAVTWYAGADLARHSIPNTGPGDKEAAQASLRACINLGAKGPAARSAIQTILAKYPRYVHVSRIENAHYGPGMGSFSDWVHTYVLSEKNKFLLAGTLIEYGSITACEHFIETRYSVEYSDGRSRTPGTFSQADVTIYVIIVVNGGWCSLARITGEDFGAEREGWERWWNSVGQVLAETNLSEPATGPETAPVALSSGSSTDELLVKGTYHMVLKTGDAFTGTVENLEGESIIFETENGEAYTFKKNLVASYELRKPPPTSDEKSGAAGGMVESQIFTYDELASRKPLGREFEVKLKGGSLFKGFLRAIDSENLRIEVSGSEIPIHRDVIRQIASVPRPGVSVDTAATQSEPESQGPVDTLYIRNPETDEYGRELKPLMLTGKIVEDKDMVVTFKTLDGTEKKVPYNQIVRRVSHSKVEEVSEIARYGKPLFCPDDMLLVDVPPGKKGRPFFKVCMDKYEYPNKAGTKPRGNVSFSAARKLCEEQGKRLCTQEEWQYACSGLEEYHYPYGWNFTRENCNTKGITVVEPSGERHKCVSKFGLHDMSGNVFEWVRGESDSPMLMGGPLSKCQSVSSGAGGDAKPQTGFRCCKSN